MAAAAVVAPMSVDQERSVVSTWSNMPDPLGKRQAVDPKHIDFINKLMSSQQRVSQMGDQPATIVNLNPYQLMVCHPLFDGLNVASCESGKDYSALVIKDVKYDVDTGMDHNHTPVEFWPIMLAKEFENQYQDKGGVFIIKGNLEKNPELALTAEFKKKYKAAFEQLITYAFSMKVSADAEWNRPNRSGRSNVHAQHRLMAKILFEHKRITKMPEWYDSLVGSEDVLPNCPACGAELKRGAYMCGICSRITDPLAAYRDGAIPETHMSLERLTRAQVEELGVSAYVAETSDEVKDRLKSGKPKPLSTFEREQIKAQQKEAAKDAKAGKPADAVKE